MFLNLFFFVFLFYLLLKKDSSRGIRERPSLVFRSVRPRFLRSSSTQRFEWDSAAVWSGDRPVSSSNSLTSGRVPSSPLSNAAAESAESEAQQRWRSFDTTRRSSGSEPILKSRFAYVTSSALLSSNMALIMLCFASFFVFVSSVTVELRFSGEKLGFPHITSIESESRYTARKARVLTISKKTKYICRETDRFSEKTHRKFEKLWCKNFTFKTFSRWFSKKLTYFPWKIKDQRKLQPRLAKNHPYLKLKP